MDTILLTLKVILKVNGDVTLEKRCQQVRAKDRVVQMGFESSPYPRHIFLKVWDSKLIIGMFVAHYLYIGLII